ncbi:hypothetical protein O3M35_012039 [Rhynocoris fuscipes]|uniref:Uncharacterized protein n=1 Tax=Rhynocoris fuscipes TaxID=488301 RepID=A0AAW1CS35_9HEMI
MLSSKHTIRSKHRKRKVKERNRSNILNIHEQMNSQKEDSGLIRNLNEITDVKERERVLRSLERLGIKGLSSSEDELDIEDMLSSFAEPNIQNQIDTNTNIIDEKGDYLKYSSSKTSSKFEKDSLNISSNITQNNLDKVSSKTSSKFDKDSLSITSNITQNHDEENKIKNENLKLDPNIVLEKFLDIPKLADTNQFMNQHVEVMSHVQNFKELIMNEIGPNEKLKSFINNAETLNSGISNETLLNISDNSQDKIKTVTTKSKLHENSKNVSSKAPSSMILKTSSTVQDDLKKISSKKSLNIVKKAKNVAAPKLEVDLKRVSITPVQKQSKVTSAFKADSKQVPLKTSLPVENDETVSNKQDQLKMSSSKPSTASKADSKQVTSLPVENNETVSNKHDQFKTSSKPSSAFKADSKQVTSLPVENNETVSNKQDQFKRSSSKPSTASKADSKQVTSLPVENNETVSNKHDQFKTSSKPSSAFKADSKQVPPLPVENNETVSNKQNQFKMSSSKPSTAFKVDSKQVPPLPVENNETVSNKHDQFKTSSKPSSAFKADSKQVPPLPVENNETVSNKQNQFKTSSKPSSAFKTDSKQVTSLPVENNETVSNKQNQFKTSSKPSSAFKADSKQVTSLPVENNETVSNKQNQFKTSSKPSSAFKTDSKQVTSLPVENNETVSNKQDQFKTSSSKPSTAFKTGSKQVSLSENVLQKTDQFKTSLSKLNVPSPYQNTLTKTPNSKKSPALKAPKMLENQIELVSKSTTYQNGLHEITSFSLKSSISYNDHFNNGILPSELHPKSYFIKSKTFTSTNKDEINGITSITETFNDNRNVITTKAFNDNALTDQEDTDEKSTDSSAKRALELKRRFNAAISSDSVADFVPLDSDNEPKTVDVNKKDYQHNSRFAQPQSASSHRSNATAKSNRSMYGIDYEPIEASKVNEEFELNEQLLDKLLLESIKMVSKFENGISQNINTESGLNLNNDETVAKNYDIPEFNPTAVNKKWSCSTMTPITKRFKRKNLTFSDVQVRNIECENRHLESRIKNVMKKPSGVSNNQNRNFIEASSSINRKKLDAKTCRENRKIENRLKEIKRKSSSNAPWAVPVWI